VGRKGLESLAALPLAEGQKVLRQAHRAGSVITNASSLPTPARVAARQEQQVVAVVEGVPRDIPELSSSVRLAAARQCAMLDEQRRSAVLALAVRVVPRVVAQWLTLRPEERPRSLEGTHLRALLSSS